MSLTLCILLAAAPPVDGRAETLTELVTIAASELDGAEVMSSKDIQRMIELEAEKQVMGCDTGAGVWRRSPGRSAHVW